MSDTMEEGVIATWLVKVGDEVSSGDILAEVETDKATMELESYDDGVLLHIGVNEKDAVPVDGVIAIIGEKGEDITAILAGLGSDNGNGSSEAAPEAPAPAASGEAIDVSSINAQVITMPKMSDTMEEGVIASWLKKVGDEVAAGDILAEVETDKATMELESYDDGTLLHIAVDAGGSVPIDGVIAIIGEEGSDVELLLKAHANPAPAASAPAPSAPEASSSGGEKKSEAVANASNVATPAVEVPASVSTSNGRVKASPLAKKIAKEKGYDINLIPGTGDGGRIVKRDVESYVPSMAPAATEVSKPDAGAAKPAISLPAVVGEESFEEVPVSQMRKVIARRLGESKFTAPHFYLTMEINMDKAIEARKSLNEVSPVKISFNDMVVKAAAAALRQHPDVNVYWLEDKIRKNHHINIGVAVAIPDGLVVPVVRFADNKSLSHISAEIKDLGQKAKDKKLGLNEMEGGTFSISNLGMFGIEEFTAIINPPEACILAVGGIKQTAVVKDGQLVPGNTMKVTLSCDHRAVDGAVGSAFLKTLKSLLEDPVRILI